MSDFDDFTDEECERLLTLLFYPPRAWKLADRVVVPLFNLAARFGGTEPGDMDAAEARRQAGTWPWPSRLVEWVAVRFDDFGLWANRRKAAKRLSAMPLRRAA